mmetsp:Transcript_4301/g.12417  ORF Transcript_4301/g.12417 Transcript_4301/m.12417 type:complete len:218 (+) Transcript_4301:2449-3102(+)
MTHWKRPAPALLIFFMLSMLNSGSRKYTLTLRIIFSEMASLSYNLRAWRKLPWPIMALAPFQPADSSSVPVGLRQHTHMQTAMTAGGGDAKALISVMSLLSRLSSASAAASRAGRASSSCSSALAFSTLMISLDSSSSCFFSSAASCDSAATFCFASMSSIIAWQSRVLPSTMIFFAASSLLIASTDLSASLSLVRPPPRRLMLSSTLRLFSFIPPR